MKVYYANSTQFHAGSIAVDEAIFHKLRGQGHTIADDSISYKPHGPDISKLRECDALVVNGEGTFRDEIEGPGHEPGRIERLMNGMAAAKVMGKKVHFINATWCNMVNDWSRILSALDEVAVREPLSAREMIETQSIAPDIYLDQSYYAPLPHRETAFDASGKIVIGTLYPHNFPDRLTESHSVFDRWRDAYLPILAPNALEAWGIEWKADWSTVVRTLMRADLYITGQHHGVYAACLAQVPFVYCKVNTHKVQGLFEWADVMIPTVQSARDVHRCVEWARSNPHVYERLFEFMEGRPEWPGL